MSRNHANWIKTFMEFTDNSEPPILYRKWVAVSILASALGRKCKLQIGELTWYPNFYIILVGPAGKCRKGTAMGVGKQFLKSIPVSVASESITREALIRELAETIAVTPTKDNKSIIQHNSLTVYSDELTVFLGYNNDALLSDLNDWYDCKDHWVYRTKNMGTDEIENLWLNIIGATTPELIRNALPADAVGSGFVSRVIFVNEYNKGKIIPLAFLSNEQEKLRESLTEDFKKINELIGSFSYTEDFLTSYRDWYLTNENNPPDLGSRLSAYIHRRQNHILKLSMIISVAEGDSMILKPSHLEQAVELLEETELKMPATFKGYGRSPVSEVLYKIMLFIKRKDRVLKSELVQRFFSELPSISEFDQLIEVMKTMNFIKESIDIKGKESYIYNKDFDEEKAGLS